MATELPKLQMMDLYTWGTPNGHKVHILLEECGVDYRIHPVNIAAKENFSQDLSRLSANKKIPILVDRGAEEGKDVTVFESGAILIYLAEKYQKFLSTETAGRYEALQWLMFQMSAVGPMMGQLNHFQGMGGNQNEYALDRFGKEVHRIHSVMELHLATRTYFAGGAYSIADMAIFPWLRVSEKLGIPWDAHPHLHAWFERVHVRPAVQRAIHRQINPATA